MGGGENHFPGCGGKWELWGFCFSWDFGRMKRRRSEGGRCFWGEKKDPERGWGSGRVGCRQGKERRR